MSIKFECPKCNKQLEAENDHIGMKLECPKCNEEVKVPKPSLKAVDSPHPVEKEKISKNKKGNDLTPKQWAQGCLTIIIIAVIIGGCMSTCGKKDGSETKKTEETKRTETETKQRNNALVALKKAKLAKFSEKVMIGINCYETKSYGLVIIGKTNLPIGSTLFCSLTHETSGVYKQVFKTQVKNDGSFEFSEFNRDEGLCKGQYIISIYSQVSSLEKESVKKELGGDLGINLKGSRVVDKKELGKHIKIDLQCPINGTGKKFTETSKGIAQKKEEKREKEWRAKIDKWTKKYYNIDQKIQNGSITVIVSSVNFSDVPPPNRRKIKKAKPGKTFLTFNVSAYNNSNKKDILSFHLYDHKDDKYSWIIGGVMPMNSFQSSLKPYQRAFGVISTEVEKDKKYSLAILDGRYDLISIIKIPANAYEENQKSK